MYLISKNMLPSIEALGKKFASINLATIRFASKQAGNDNDKESNYVITEDLPPIPPNYGWRGDENIKNIYEIRRIKASFKYGGPPKIKRRMLHGPQVIRILPITHCSNRPFYRIAVTRQNSSLQDPFIEDLGSIDPMPNKDNQILVALNLERLKYYMSRSVPLKGLVGHYLGLAGFLPLHPHSYLKAYRNRLHLKELEKKKAEETKEKVAKAEN